MNITDYRIHQVISKKSTTDNFFTGIKVAALAGFPDQILGRLPTSSHYVNMDIDVLYLKQDNNASEAFMLHEGNKYVVDESASDFHRVVKMKINGTIVVDSTGQEVPVGTPGAIREIDFFINLIESGAGYFDVIRQQMLLHNDRPDEKNKYILPVNGKDILYLSR